MDFSLLKQLLTHAEDFQRQQPDPQAPGSLAEFSAWLQQRVSPAERLEAVAREPRRPTESDESQIGMLATFIYRYLRGYSRLALAGTPLATLDDFAYLATVYGHQPISKTEAIARNIQEKATGTEVIKRLLAAGLIREEASATDRRRKLLTVTEEGGALLFRLFARMDQVAQMGAGNLSPAERQQLVYLLLKLDAFHNPVFRAPRPDSFEELLRRHFPHVPAQGSWPPQRDHAHKPEPAE